jgi:hypothetical protein
MNIDEDTAQKKNYQMIPYTCTKQNLPRYNNSTFPKDICNVAKSKLLGQKTIQTSMFIKFTPSTHSMWLNENIAQS